MMRRIQMAKMKNKTDRSVLTGLIIVTVLVTGGPVMAKKVGTKKVQLDPSPYGQQDKTNGNGKGGDKNKHVVHQANSQTIQAGGSENNGNQKNKTDSSKNTPTADKSYVNKVIGNQKQKQQQRQRKVNR